MLDYGTKSNKFYRFILVLIDKFGKNELTVSMKNKAAQTIRQKNSPITFMIIIKKRV